MKLYQNALRLLAGAFSLASVAGLRASSSNEDPLEVSRKLISSSNFDSAALKESLGSLNSKLVQKQFEKQHGRHLETGRQCGEVFASVTLAEVKEFLGIYVSFLLPANDPVLGPLTGNVEQALFASVQYGFKAVKVCMSCEEAIDVLSNEQLASSDPYSYSSYCSEEQYGYGADHSALVFLPVDPATGEVFKASIRAIFSGHSGTLLDVVAAAPTEIWPSNMTEFLATNSPDDILASTMDYLVAAVGAASGAIVVNPDFIGYGESAEYNRTDLAAMPYAQSFALSWFATQKYVANSTAGCSELENVVTVSGYSEGGYAALPGSFALQQLGVTIWGAFPGGAPFEEASLMPLLEQVDFNTVLCHSPLDDVISYDNVPSFPFSNEMVSMYAGVPLVPGVNILPPTGGHVEANILCSVSPIRSLQVPVNGPLQITSKQCPGAAASVAPTPMPTVAPTPMPTVAPAATGNPDTASTNSMFLSTIVLGLMLGVFAI